ncbi:hypothetical protein L195_g030262 [Trifolium pratense]|uniref:Uncharacterized protein n=1 Tax=Trifolium pratense TaxID=57577 RepID=A0A2K3L725_TRIPR|nr:hypothetical protein L195_g030262 [Trifolium pratense]
MRSLHNMGNTSKNADRRKRATKASASARKENAAQNSPKKWSRKAPATSGANETVRPGHEAIGAYLKFLIATCHT